MSAPGWLLQLSEECMRGEELDLAVEQAQRGVATPELALHFREIAAKYQRVSVAYHQVRVEQGCDNAEGKAANSLALWHSDRARAALGYAQRIEGRLGLKPIKVTL